MKYPEPCLCGATDCKLCYPFEGDSAPFEEFINEDEKDEEREDYEEDFENQD